MVKRLMECSIRLSAWIVGGALLMATNYCAYEAFSGGHAHVNDTHQHAPVDHHDESPSRANDSCCSTLHAVVIPQFTLLLARGSPLLRQAMSLQAIPLVGFIDLSAIPNNLSPPAHEPIPARPFYRTTFANHAPPHCFS
ncbi:MAG: hypothetical protein HY352_02225 [Candidatus Omnitrophica bacterium]|nr:hypothetical protein [Candidatus Omnitrophota bacterium]